MPESTPANDPDVEEALVRGLGGHQFHAVTGIWEGTCSVCINCGTLKSSADGAKKFTTCNPAYCPPTPLTDDRTATGWGSNWLSAPSWVMLEDYRESIGLPRRPYEPS